MDYVCYLDGVTLAYCAVFDQLPQMLQEARPTIIVAVPRVYEKVRGEAERRAGHGLKRKIFDWAVRVGEKHKEEIARGEDSHRALLWKIANQLVFSKIRQGFGGRSRAYFSGGAPWAKTWQSGFARWAFPSWKATG